MATTEMEAAAVRPGEIAGHRFTVARRGYEPEGVDRFLEGVADQLARLQGEIEWQRARIEHLERLGTAAEDSAYDRIAREFMKVVRRADEAATQVRAKAEDEARAAPAVAREEAHRILETTAQESERLLQEARTDAEGLVAEFTRQVERVILEVWPEAPITAPSGHEAIAVPAPLAAVVEGANGSWHGPDPETAGFSRFQAVPQAANGHQPVRPRPELPEPAFADFEALTLELESSAFDLLGDAGS